VQKILAITDIELTVLRSFPPQIRIVASGTVTSSGWTNPQLVPYTYIQDPPDGIYDFDFIAEAPEEIATQVITPITTIYRDRTFPQGMKGVRVHSSTNGLVAFFNPEDCPHSKDSVATTA
jgi:hypothetical protein